MLATVILAAGMSQRMGSPKALLDIGGQPLIGRLIATIEHVPDIQRIVIVTGHEPPRIQGAVTSPKIEFAHNARYAEGGMLSSVKTGARAVAGGCSAFFLCLLDQPLVLAGTMIALARAHEHGRSLITLPTLGGKRGHPILLDADSINPIVALPEDASLRDFVSRHENEIESVEVHDRGIRTSMDTPADYQKIIELWKERSNG